jgi:phenylacetate-coenzyme A ligase PaaK-like adenylate-forming protein
MERVFHCVVSDMYGAHDGGIVAHCIQGGFKVGYNCIVQVEGGSNSGPALLTDVISSAFPFIRYKLGDELTLGKGYSAFYSGQVLDSVLGRTSDVIELENGRVLTGPGFTVLFSKLDVQGYRIYKSGNNEITVEIVKGKSFTEEQEKLMVDTMHKHAGDDCSIRVKYADKLQNRVNGKNLFFLNENVNVPQ